MLAWRKACFEVSGLFKMTGADSFIAIGKRLALVAASKGSGLAKMSLVLYLLRQSSFVPPWRRLFHLFLRQAGWSVWYTT